MSFEGSTVPGSGVAEVLAGIPLPEGTPYEITSTDVQPSCAEGALLVFVTGEMAGNKVQQVFHLVPTAEGGFYIHNDIFRVSDSGSTPENAMEEMGGDVGKAFVLHYYEMFDTARDSLATLYRDASMLSMEGKQFGTPDGGGVGAIMEHLCGVLPPTKHELGTIDVQYVSPDKSVILCFVTGKMIIEGSENPLYFAQTFQLVSTGDDGGYYVHNDIFRFNLG